jgi:hypothetical protein
MALLRGPSGSVVYLRVAGPEKGSPIRDIDLERRPIPQPPVKLVRHHHLYKMRLKLCYHVLDILTSPWVYKGHLH